MLRPESELEASRLSTRTLAAEVISRNHVQLSWVAVAALVAILSMTQVAAVLQPEVAASQRIPLVQWTIGLATVLSVLMIMVERLGWLRPIGLLRCAMAYQVLIAAAIAVFESAAPWREQEMVRGSSSITLWLMGFMLLVPATPVMAAGFCLLAAAMGPLVHWAMHEAAGLPAAPWNRLLIMYGPAFLMPFVAALINVRVLSLERLAARARDMGSYELYERLNRGGMGEVWRARHRFLKRDAAVKVIRPDVLLVRQGREAEMLRRRFEQEARAIATLKSPHTVAIHDFGVMEDGGFYYAMELLEGYNLQALVAEHGPQPPGRVVNIIRQACASLEEAHRRGLIHRDVKPANLFLCQLGTSYDFCKLLDFGLVKRLLADGESWMTLDGAMAGTPSFLAPEVAAGAREVDGRVDLYGLGCVAYWLLTGTLVFDEPNAAAAMAAHLQKTPEPPSQRVEWPIPEDLERLVMQCLAKRPEDRPESAAELARLAAECRGVTPWTEEDAERWWRLNAPARAAVH
jgi:serine/threonine-protein kinase